MKFTRKLNGKNLVIAVEGKLDTLTAPSLSEELDKGLDGVESLLWDFSRLDYISSAGIRVLLYASSLLSNPDNMKVSGACEMVKTALVLTGLDSWLED